MNRAHALKAALARAVYPAIALGLGAGLISGCPCRTATPPGKPKPAQPTDPWRPPSACFSQPQQTSLLTMVDTTRPKGGETGGGCPEEGCGPNSAFMNGYHIDELNLAQGNSGLPNHNGVRIIGFQEPADAPAPGPYQLLVRNGELVARSLGGPTGEVELRGVNLEGSKIIVELPATPPGEVPALPAREDVIVIDAYEQGKLWVPFTDPVGVHRYRLTYAPTEYGFTKADDESCFTVPICSVATTSGKDLFAWAVVVSAERYGHDDTTHLAQPQILTSLTSTGWFNLACEGNALYKTKMLGYDPSPDPSVAPQLVNAGSEPGDVSKRQATLKMITADYCGINRSFTKNGTEVAWVNLGDTVDTREGACSNGQPATEVEAYWGSKGALCVRGNGPLRRPEWDLAKVNDECQADHPELAPLPSCEDFTPPDGAWMWKTYVCPAP